MKSFALWQAILILTSLVGVNTMLPRTVGIQEDATSNFFGSFQNELFAKTLYFIAKECLKRYNFEECKEDQLDFEIFHGNYRLELIDKGYSIEISVMHKNPRNLHITRYFTKKQIKRSNAKDF